MKKIILLYKKIAQTPLDAIRELKIKNPELRSVKMAYAGRLDPMAEGLLLVLTGDECKNRDLYQEMNKEYIVEILFGVGTDSYDILGLVKRRKESVISDKREVISKKNIAEKLKEFQGRFMQKYPPFSSKVVVGKPLYWWARKDRLNEIIIPDKEVRINKIKLLELYKIEALKLRELILAKIELVKGDFRQGKIIKSWEKYFKETMDKYFYIAKIQVSCSSGTYIRSLVHIIGERMNCPTVTLSILRTQVGNFTFRNI